LEEHIDRILNSLSTATMPLCIRSYSSNIVSDLYSSPIFVACQRFGYVYKIFALLTMVF